MALKQDCKCKVIKKMKTCYQKLSPNFKRDHNLQKKNSWWVRLRRVIFNCVLLHTVSPGSCRVTSVFKPWCYLKHCAIGLLASFSQHCYMREKISVIIITIIKSEIKCLQYRWMQLPSHHFFYWKLCSLLYHCTLK